MLIEPQQQAALGIREEMHLNLSALSRSNSYYPSLQMVKLRPREMQPHPQGPRACGDACLELMQVWRSQQPSCWDSSLQELLSCSVGTGCARSEKGWMMIIAAGMWLWSLSPHPWSGLVLAVSSFNAQGNSQASVTARLTLLIHLPRQAPTLPCRRGGGAQRGYAAYCKCSTLSLAVKSQMLWVKTWPRNFLLGILEVSHNHSVPQLLYL